MAEPFWESKSLFEMSREEWESVCDGCAKCCLQQLEDEDSAQLVFTDVVCDLLDCASCQCTDYPNRSVRVPTCVTLTPDNVESTAEFAPPSCAYVRLLQGRGLPDWHHLVCGDRDEIHRRGKSVRGRVRRQSEVNADDLEDYVVTWPASDT